ncbi:MAG TPA: aspartate/glutamate racemase family protein [Burkholderiales bacterium]|nr:aspartate/glutamate racemase family protein [Burkholderiales bacterium]
MKKPPKIYLIHAADVAMPPIVASFRANWPQARIVNLLEDGLMNDLAADGRLTAAMTERFVQIGHYCVKAAADAILFTCSAFGPAIEECRRQVAIPVLKPNEAMYEQLVAKSGTVSLLATFQPSLPSMLAEIAALAKQEGTNVTVRPHLVEGALAALQDNRPDDHNRLIAETAAKQQGCDAIALAQFSMAAARTLAASFTTTPILTTPDSAVAKLKILLE